MKSFDTQEYFDRYSPLASTEEKSIHDNISLNKQSLEKGLRNRPDPNALIDRGILRNPGKAFSDKMSQLDLAKKRDKLKMKIANRPEREELVRKLILQEQNDNREKKLDRIKQRLDDSINNRPGSLELVGKNILQVDRLLASRIQSGEITYPKVCGDGNFSDSLSNHSTPLPSISEIDIPNTLSELSDLQSSSGLSSTKSNNRNLQYSCKKTYRVGRYSFHNIEFRPAAQKAREYQQNQLVQFEEIQAQRNPNLKRLHSELAIKSHHHNETAPADPNYNVPKYSLLHRLNVHELKSECKIRMISCSNIPKVQLVEKLLPYESEILASHTSFDLTNRSSTPSQSNRRSMPVMKSSRDFSPPETKNSNTNGSLYASTQSSNQLPGIRCASSNCTKMIHSHSEPLIQNYTNGGQQNVSSFINGFHFFPISNSVQNSNFSFINIDDVRYNQSLNQFNPNNSYPSLSYHPTNLSMNIESFPPKQNNVQEHLYESDNLNNWQNLNEHLSQHQTPRAVTPVHPYNDDVHVKSESEILFSCPDFFKAKLDLSPIIIPSEISIPQPIHIDCGNKFDCINNELSKLIQIIDRIKWITLQKNTEMPSTLIDQFKLTKINLVKMVNEMISFIHKEITYKAIDISNAQIQQNWLNNLLISIENNFQSNNAECVKMENDYSESSRLWDDVVNNNNNIIYKCSNNQVDGLETLNFDPINSLSIQTQNECFFSESLNNGYKEEIDHFNLNDLSIPETPITDIVNSSLYNDFDDFMDDLLNVPENVIS